MRADLLEGYMDEDEFAKAINKARVTVRHMRRRGKGPPYIKLGATILYKRNDAIAWLQSLTCRPPRERR